MTAKLPYPNFATESEEADWLYEHSEELDLYFSPMQDNAREIFLRDHGLSLSEARVTLTVSVEDLASAKTMAKIAGLTLEACLGQVVHEALTAKKAA